MSFILGQPVLASLPGQRSMLPWCAKTSFLSGHLSLEQWVSEQALTNLVQEVRPVGGYGNDASKIQLLYPRGP